MFSISTKFGWINILILFLLTTRVQAQVEQQARFELLLPEERDLENFQVTSLNEDGLLIYRLNDDLQTSFIELIKTDSTLSEKWRGQIPIDPLLTISSIKVKENVIFMLLRPHGMLNSGFKLITLSGETGTYSLYTINNLIPFSPTDFAVTNNSVLIGGYFNYRPLVLHFSFETQRSKILPGFFNEVGELNQIKVYPDGSSDIIVCAKNFERKKCLWIRTYDAEGDLVKTTILNPDKSKNLIFGRSVKMPDGKQIVSGVYGRTAEYSRGIFIAEINPYGEYTMNYHNFSDLQNFFSYMKARKEKRVKERIERRKVKGKKIRFNYRFLVQEVIPYKNQYIMMGEAFYPQYRYLNDTRGGYGSPMFGSDRIFDGYRYTHAIMIGFDQQGKLIWDNSFEINDVKTFTLEQFVKIAPEEERVVLLYLFDNMIRSKIINNEEVLEGKSLEALNTRFSGDVVLERSTTTSHLEYWYSNHFYAYGIQTIKNPSFGKNSRRVFFINKLAY